MHIFLFGLLSIAMADNSGSDVLEPSLKMLRDLQQGKIIGPFADRIQKPFVAVSIRFGTMPTNQMFADNALLHTAWTNS